MKKIEAFIRVLKLDEVRRAVVECGIEGMTITDVHGYGREKPDIETYRGVEQPLEFVQRAKVEVVVSDEQVDRVVHAMLDSAQTGQVGDGRILVSNLAEVVSIRTGETAAAALV